MVNCPLCEKKMREYHDHYRCTHDNIKQYKYKPQRADLFKRNPIHPVMRIVYRIIETVTNPYVLTFLAMSLTFALVAFWIGVSIASANYYHL